MKPVLKPWSVAVLVLGVAMAARCSPTPVQPTASASQSNGLTAAAHPTPTPDPVKCTCTDVGATFDPGGATPSWGVYGLKENGVMRVGFRIDVTCDGKGQSNLCDVYQIEKGQMTWTIGKREGKLIGRAKKVNNFPVANTGDPWHKEYSDALGGDYPLNTAEKMHVELNMEFEIKCISSDKTTVVSKKFKIEGSVDAQAPSRGAEPKLTNAKITFTPL